MHWFEGVLRFDKGCSTDPFRRRRRDGELTGGRTRRRGVKQMRAPYRNLRRP